MRLAKKKIPKGHLLLALSFMAVSFCSLIIISTARMGRMNQLSQNGLYSGHQRDFSITDAAREDLWQDIIPQLKDRHKDFTIYVPIADPNIIIKGICTVGRPESPPMLQGTYFDPASSWTSHPSAVIGKEYSQDITQRGGKPYYTYGGIEFEVLGIMGTKEESRINHMVVTDFQSATAITGINTSYVLDAQKESSLLEVGQDLSSCFPFPANVVILLEQGMEPSLLARMLSGNTIMNTMYALILICFSLSTILVTLIWFRFRRQLFYAWELCGYKSYWKHLETSKAYFQVAGIGFAAGLLLAAAVSRLASDIQIMLTDILLSLAVTIGLGVAILAISKKLSSADKY